MCHTHCIDRRTSKEICEAAMWPAIKVQVFASPLAVDGAVMSLEWAMTSSEENTRIQRKKLPSLYPSPSRWQAMVQVHCIANDDHIKAWSWIRITGSWICCSGSIMLWVTRLSLSYTLSHFANVPCMCCPQAQTCLLSLFRVWSATDPSSHLTVMVCLFPTAQLHYWVYTSQYFVHTTHMKWAIL